MDYFPIALCVILTFSSSILFGLDLKGYFNSAVPAIAWVTDATGTVRKLAREDFTWDRAQNGTPFASKDTVATGEEASAKIYFKDGAEVVLEPASMLVIDTRSDELVLNFVTGGGKVRVARNSARRVVASRAPIPDIKAAPAQDSSAPAESRIAVDVVDELPAPPPPSVHAAVPAPAAPPMERALAPKPIAETALRDPGVSAKIREELAAIETLPSPPSLLIPEEGSRLDLGGQQKITLTWSPEAHAQTAGYEVTLRSETVSKTISSKEASVTVPSLEPGRYLWSVRAVRTSPSGRLRSPAAPPRWFEVVRSAALDESKLAVEVPQPQPKPKPIKTPPRSAVENKKVKLLPVSVE